MRMMISRFIIIFTYIRIRMMDQFAQGGKQSRDRLHRGGRVLVATEIDDHPRDVSAKQSRSTKKRSRASCYGAFCRGALTLIDTFDRVKRRRLFSTNFKHMQILIPSMLILFFADSRVEGS